MRICTKIIHIIIFILIVLKVNSQNKDSLNIYDLSLDQLMNLQIASATKSAETITDIPASIVIISRQTIQEQGWQTLEEVLSNVPGMYMINDYLWFGTDNFGVRGFFSTGSFNTMVVLVNGVNQKEDWYNSFPLTKINVPVEAIDRIEIIRGPMSVVYGNSAFLGAINIVTDQSSVSSVKAGLGSNGNYRTFARVNGGNDKNSFTLNAAIYGSNGIDRPYSEMTDNIDNSWGISQNKTSKGQLADNRKYLDFSYKTGDFHFGLLQSFTRRGVIDYYPGYEDGHLAEIQSTSIFGGFSKEIYKDVSSNFNVGYYSFRNKLDYKHNSDTTAYTFNDIYSDAFDAELNINLKPNSKLDVSVGSYFQMVLRDKLVVDAPNLSNNYVNLDAGLSRSNRKYTWAAFTQVRYSFNKRFSILGGLRIEQTPSYTINYAVRFDPTGTYEYLARNGTYKYGEPYLIPRVALLYHVTDEHHLKLMYGKAIKQASMGENMDIVRYPENDQLKPANMQTVELNYIGKVVEQGIVNLSFYFNNVNNLISRTNQLSNGVMTLINTNSGKLRTYGIEFSTDWKIVQRLSLSCSYIFQYSQNKQNGYDTIALEYAPKNLAYSTISYKFYKSSTIALSGYYIGSMETYWRPDKITGVTGGKRIGEKGPAYFLMNLNIRLNDLFKKDIFCTFHVHNLLNTTVKFPTTTSNDEFEKGTFGYSRYFTVGVGYNFGKASK